MFITEPFLNAHYAPSLYAFSYLILKIDAMTLITL